jgi:hypothetical protein
MTIDVENKTLVLDLLEWVARQPRPYAEVMEAWRTSCPRFPVWEDAVDRGLLAQVHDATLGEMVHVTPAGKEFLRTQGRLSA